MRGTATRSGLVGLGAHPLHQTGFVQSAHAHQHATDGAVAAHPIETTFGKGVFDHRQVHRVEDDDGVIFHAQGRGGIDPMALPARAAQLGKHLRGVVAALAGDDDVAGFEGVYVVAIEQLGFVFRHGRRCATRVGGGEKHGLDQVEVFFGLHAVHQDRADHATPADQADSVSDFFHGVALSIKMFFDSRLVWPGRARRTRAVQPLAVVVVMEMARSAPAAEALVVFKRTYCMDSIVADSSG